MEKFLKIFGQVVILLVTTILLLSLLGCKSMMTCLDTATNREILSLRILAFIFVLLLCYGFFRAMAHDHSERYGDIYHGPLPVMPLPKVKNYEIVTKSVEYGPISTFIMNNPDGVGVLEDDLAFLLVKTLKNEGLLNYDFKGDVFQDDLSCTVSIEVVKRK